MPQPFSFDDDETLDTAADTLIETMPEPSEEAVAAMSESIAQPEDEAIKFDDKGNIQSATTVSTPATPAHENDGQRDDSGVLFDANIHTDTKLKNGKWRLKRKPKNGSRIAGNKQPTTDPAVEAAAKTALMQQQARAAGVAAAGLTFMTCTALGGAEWKPREEPINERNVMEEAYGNYFVAKNITDFPPGVALSIALCMYAAPRFTMPETRSRMSRFKTWTVAKVANWKLRREARKRGISVKELREEMERQANED